MRIIDTPLFMAALFLSTRMATATSLSAQGADSTVTNAQRSMVTRVEIQAALDEIEKGLASSAYSPALRGAKQQTAAVLRDRLTEGDIRAGDKIRLSVLGEPSLSDTFDVTPARTIMLPGGAEIPLRGVLRSEVKQYLTTKLTAFVKDPTVDAMSYVRLQIFGAVGKPGFFYAPANMLLSEVIQNDGGGPLNNAQFKKSQIKRNGHVVLDGSEFQDAIFRGRSLDQLNVQAGDEIVVAAKPSKALPLEIVAALSTLGGLVYLGIRIF
ncbi:MAG: polysaccharide biosynthesis/export family protein [Gemmatimonadales bacterium]